MMELIIDVNENTNKPLTAHLEKQGILLVPEDLEVGDFFIPPYIIERKEFSDFISSSKNHGGLRVMEQLRRMKKYSDSGYKPILLIEGDEETATKNKVRRTNLPYQAAFNQIQGLKISVAADFGIPVIHTRDMAATAYTLKRLLEKSSKPSKKAIPIRSSVPASRPTKEKVRYLLEGIPYVGAKTSERIMAAYPTLKDFFGECMADPSLVKKRIGRINKNIPAEVKNILEWNLHD